MHQKPQEDSSLKSCQDDHVTSASQRRTWKSGGPQVGFHVLRQQQPSAFGAWWRQRRRCSMPVFWHILSRLDSSLILDINDLKYCRQHGITITLCLISDCWSFNPQSWDTLPSASYPPWAGLCVMSPDLTSSKFSIQSMQMPLGSFLSGIWLSMR